MTSLNCEGCGKGNVTTYIPATVGFWHVRCYLQMQARKAFERHVTEPALRRAVQALDQILGVADGLIAVSVGTLQGIAEVIDAAERDGHVK